ncbi:transcription initiation protein [Nonomuraea deserti]|uniref:Transcription initiation protein n=1 Tax=Nonomuraea deserti TaxID=1848322 RepID=A0A4R4UYQ7_9ACTN|nr:YciI family protein [Nonomuraea deserti]TDC97878.1 transcription initiation protein [Nonomuraea deserti]
MKFLLLICGDQQAHKAMLADPDFLPDCKAWARAQGDRLVQTGGLEAPAEATTVRARDGEVLLSDGPFVEAKEVVAGFSLIECATREQALEAAMVHPVARHGTIEVRALLP